jgi:muramoyltetrapeptide carboxypeptidase
MTSIKPPILRRGDKVGIIAPASNIKPELLEAGAAGLRRMGYEPVFLPGILERDLYFAGPIERRMAELNEMLERDDIAALICARGGYGANYLLEQIDFEAFRQHPKVFAGYSDNTSLLTAIHDRSGIVTFHGPMVTKDFATPDCVEPSSWQNAIGGAGRWNIPADGTQVLKEGRAGGKLYGGCLSLLAASLGTPFEIQTEETILFIEDIGAKPYQIDRMLMQLRLAGKLERVQGFVFGEMVDSVQPGGQDYTLQEVIMRFLNNYDVPVVYGLRSGHVSRGNITLPIGVQAELIAHGTQVTLRILETATEESGDRVIG